MGQCCPGVIEATSVTRYGSGGAWKDSRIRRGGGGASRLEWTRHVGATPRSRGLAGVKCFFWGTMKTITTLMITGTGNERAKPILFSVPHPVSHPSHIFPWGGENSNWISGSWSQRHGCSASLVTCCIWKHCWGWAWMGIWACDLPLLPTQISGKLTSKSPWLRGQWGRVQESGPPEFKYWLTSQVPLGKQFNSTPRFTHLQNRDDDSNDLTGWL